MTRQQRLKKLLNKWEKTMGCGDYQQFNDAAYGVAYYIRKNAKRVTIRSGP